MQIQTIPTIRGKFYGVVFDRYNARLIESLKKQFSQRSYWRERNMWMIPCTIENAQQLHRFESYAAHFEQVFWGERPAENDNVEFRQPDMPNLQVEHSLKIEPYKYQLEGIARGLQLRRFINGDDMGLGKTLESIATINIANAFPCLVICPNVVKINWQREWQKFTDKQAMVLSDSVRDSWRFFWQTGMNQVFITNYESLKKYFVAKIAKPKGWRLSDVTFKDSIRMFKSVIIDESHKIKDPTTQQAKLCRGISEGKEYIIMLTGTPVVNKPRDLASQLAILGRIPDFGGYKYFLQRYCGGSNGASNLRELKQKLWDNCFFRREKQDVLTQLPDKIRTVISCDITNRTEYAEAENDLIEYLKKYKEADDEKIMKALKGEVMVRIGILKNITARGKMRDVIDFVNDFRENGKKIILFCNLHEIVDEIVKVFPTAVCITGRQTMEEKQAAIDSFQRNPNTDIAICSIKAASAGITLTAASNVAFVELPWTFADCDQAESRAHRIGQKDTVNCHYLLGRDTIDEKIYKIIQEKKQVSAAVTGASDNIETNIVDIMAKIFIKQVSAPRRQTPQ